MDIRGRTSRPTAAVDPHEYADDAEESPAVWFSPTVLAGASGLVLVVVTVADALISAHLVVLTVFLGLSPLLASAVLGPAATAAFAAVAVCLAAVSGEWNEAQGAQYWVRIADVVLVGALAVLVPPTPPRREADLRASRRIATAAQ